MVAQRRGIITAWKDDKGFGFITPDDGGTPIFFHVSGLVQRQTRPSVNLVVLYTLSHDQQLRPRAIQVRFAQRPREKIALPVCIVALFFLVLLLATLVIQISPWIVLLYALSSSLTYGLYALDKASAIQGEWRIPESALHFLELVGGWPGALVAQHYYRHKTMKASYQALFWTIVVMNLALLIGYSYAQYVMR